MRAVRTIRLLRQARSLRQNWPLAARRPAGPTTFSAGFSLFEVVIALAIFVASITAIGQLVSSGVRGAVRSRLQTHAVLRCESKMAEVVAGITPLQSVSDIPFPDDSSWTSSVSIQPGPHPDLYLVSVVVSHFSTGQLSELSYSLTRLVRDPSVSLQMVQDEQAKQKAASQGSSTNPAGTSPTNPSTTGGTR
jgi:Tfp pilus assembly protein PilV